MKRLVLIDGINFFYRGAWSGVSQDMKTIHGEDMTYVLAYFRNLATLVSRFRGDDNTFIICWDGGYDERLRISSDAVKAGLIQKSYKQERRESHDIEDEEEKQKAVEFMRQMRVAKEYTGMTNVAQMSMKGEEADDIIGSYSVKYSGDFDEILLVTTDKDYFQLLTDKVRIYNSGKNEYRDLQYLKSEYNLDSGGQWIDVGALAGESGPTSDTIYGVQGIGYKTAAKLIAEYGSLDRLVEQSLVALAPDIMKCGNDVKLLNQKVKDKSYKLKHHRKELSVLASKEIVDLAKRLKAMRTFLPVEIPPTSPSWTDFDRTFRAMGVPLGRGVTDTLTE